MDERLGKMPEVIERRKRTWRVLVCGCLATIMVLLIAGYALYRLLIGIGSAGQFSVRRLAPRSRIFPLPRQGPRCHT